MKKSIVIIVVITIVAVVFYGIRYVNMPVDIMTARAENKESKISADGLIVYDETVYEAENTGTFYSYTGEGERVGKERRVATVYDGVVDKEILQSLYNLDKKINDIEDNKRNTVYLSDESSDQALIESVKGEIIDSVIEGDVSKISEYKNRLKMAVGVGGEEDESQNLEQLKEQKKEIESQISQKNKDIYSNMSGIYTTSLDGLEGVIAPEDLGSYTVSDYRELKTPENNIMGSRTVQNGDVVCKVVDNHEWYAVFVVSKADRERIEVGDNVKMRVLELPGHDVEATIAYISEEAEDAQEYLVSVKCERYLEGVFNIRKSGIEIILDSFFGFEVPVYAIRVRDGKNGVMVQGSGAEIFKECRILNRDDEKGMVIVEPTGTGNELINGDQIILGEK